MKMSIKDGQIQRLFPIPTPIANSLPNSTTTRAPADLINTIPMADRDRDNRRRTCQPPQGRGRQTQQRQRQPQQQRPNQQQQRRGRRQRYGPEGQPGSVLRQPSRETPQQPAPRHTRFQRDQGGGGGGGSRERLAPPGSSQVAMTGAQRWFKTLNGVRRVRQTYVNHLQKLKPSTKEGQWSTRAFDDKRNEDYNRYTDVILLDATRIKLRNGPGGNDYIHASQVKGADFPIICTQGPVDESIERFWIMVAEQRSQVIVQLCQNEEEGKEKCADYVPKNKPETFGSVTVRVKEKAKSMTANPAVTRTELEVVFGGHSLEVSHFLYNAWPDHDVPLSATAFRQLRTTVHKLATTKKCPVIVHCSAGIGRTGTYAAIEIAIRGIVQEDKVVVISNLVRDLRHQRAMAVQNDIQFLFIHRAVIDAALDAGRLTPEDRAKEVGAFISEYEQLVQRKRRERKLLLDKKRKD